MRSFTNRTMVQASLEAVAAFHRDSQTLKALTPPPIFVQLHQVEPLAEGSLADFTLWIGPLPVRWTAVHSDVDPLYGFTDTQALGPYETWVHRHTFEAVTVDSTDVVDEIRANFGSGIFNGLVSRLMWWGLPLLFAYRGWVTRREARRVQKGAKDDFGID